MNQTKPTRVDFWGVWREWGCGFAFGTLAGLLGTNLELLWWGLNANFVLLWHRHDASPGSPHSLENAESQI